MKSMMIEQSRSAIIVSKKVLHAKGPPIRSPLLFVCSAVHVKSCHTPFRDSGNEASIRVPRLFHSHV
jgi:hypothetical protein